MHFPGNTLIEIDGDVAWYVDRLERRDHGPSKFAERHVVFEFSHKSAESTGRERLGEREVAQRSLADLVYRIRGG